MSLAMELRKVAQAIREKKATVGKRIEGYDLVKSAANIKLSIYSRLLQAVRK